MKKNKYIYRGRKKGFRLLPLLLITVLTSLQCQEKAMIKTMIITGGHSFEEASFFTLFDSFDDITYQAVIQPEANQAYASPMIDSVDVLIFYDMVQDISDEQKAAMIRLLEKGKSLLFLHHSLASYQDWEEFIKIIGGKYHMPKKSDDPSDKPESNFKHDVDLTVSIVDKNHPVTSGLSEFEIHDEIYGNFQVQPGVYPLLTTDHPESGEILAWINHYKNSWIVYIQLGHDHYAYENANFRKLVGQSIRWLADPKSY